MASRLTAPNNINNILDVGDTEVSLQIEDGRSPLGGVKLLRVLRAVSSSSGDATVQLHGLVTPSENDHAANKAYVDSAISGLNISQMMTTIQNLQQTVTALQNTTSTASEITSGTVVEVADDSNGPFMANIETSSNNPAVKIFNASGKNLHYSSVSNGHTITGGIDHGQTEVIHHSAIGEVDITFNSVIDDDAPGGHIIVESAGG